MANKNPNKSTRFQPGVSGNYGGRPKGTKNRYSLKKFAEELSKCRGESLEYVKKAMREAEKPADMLKAAIALWSQDREVQKMMFDEVMNEIKIEDAKAELELKQQKLEKLKNEPSDKPEKKDDDNTPVLSLKAITGGKE